jgi:hypothetical protein
MRIIITLWPGHFLYTVHEVRDTETRFYSSPVKTVNTDPGINTG